MVDQKKSKKIGLYFINTLDDFINNSYYSIFLKKELADDVNKTKTFLNQNENCSKKENVPNEQQYKIVPLKQSNRETPPKDPAKVIPPSRKKLYLLCSLIGLMSIYLYHHMLIHKWILFHWRLCV